VFELLFAWAVFTAVLGKSAESVMHAWRGTAPPGHQRRMARIRAREARAARTDHKPSEGFRGWARTVWADSWDAATERHRERWPDKAARKAQYARQRWAWWDGVQGEAEQRWEQRRRERDRQSAARAAQEAARAWEEAARARAENAKAHRQAQDARRHAEHAETDTTTDEEGGSFRRTADGSTWYTHPGPGPFDTREQRVRQAEDRARRAEETARAAADFARRAQERADQAQREQDRPTTTVTPEPEEPQDSEAEEDISDAEIVYPELEATPASGPDTTTTTAPQPNFTTTNNNDEESSDMSNTTEAIGLDGAMAFAAGVVNTCTANVSTTETVVAAMQNGRVGQAVIGRTQQLMEAMDAAKNIAEGLQADLERMKAVQEQYDANPDAGDKDYVATNAGR